MTALLEPIMMVFLGGVVGGMIIAMYLPIFKLAAIVGWHRHYISKTDTITGMLPSALREYYPIAFGYWIVRLTLQIPRRFAPGIIRSTSFSVLCFWNLDLIKMVGMARFERATPASRTQCPTKLGHIPTRPRKLYNLFPNVHLFIRETPIIMKLRYYKRSTVISVGCNETQSSETKCTEDCKSNYPTCEAKRDYFEIWTSLTEFTEACRSNQWHSLKMSKTKFEA